MFVYQRIFRSAARAKLPLEMMEKISSGTVFSAIKGELFSLGAKLNSRELARDTTNRSYYIKKIQSILACISMPFNMSIDDDDLLKLFACVREIGESFHTSEFCILLSEWLTAQIQQSDVPRVSFLLELVNSTSISVEGGLNTLMLRNIGAPKMLSLMRSSQTPAHSATILVFLTQSLGPPDAVMTAEVIRDIEKAWLELVYRNFSFSKRDSATVCAMKFKELLRITRTVSADSSFASHLKQLVQKFVNKASLEPLVAFSEFVGQKKGIARKEITAHTSLTQSIDQLVYKTIIVKVMGSRECKALKNAKDLLTLLDLMNNMDNTSPQDLAKVLQHIAPSIHRAMKKSDLSEMVILLDAYAQCVLRCGFSSTSASIMEELLTRLLSKIANQDIENIDSRTQFNLANSLSRLCEMTSPTTTIKRVVFDILSRFLRSREALQPDIAASIAQALRCAEARSAATSLTMKAETSSLAQGPFSSEVANALLVRAAHGGAAAIIATISAIRAWYKPMDETLLAECSRRISLHSGSAVPLKDSIACLQVLCDHRHAIHMNAIVQIANYLDTLIEDLDASDILEVLLCFARGRIKYDRLTDSLYLRAAALDVSSAQALQLLFFLQTANNRKLKLAEKFTRTALRNPMYYSVVSTIGQNLGLNLSAALIEYLLNPEAYGHNDAVAHPVASKCVQLIHILDAMKERDLKLVITKHVIPLAERSITEGDGHSRPFAAALLLRCRQILGEDAIKDLFQDAALQMLHSQIFVLPSTNIRPDFMLDEQQSLNWPIHFCEAVATDPSQLLPFCSPRIRDAAAMFVIFGGTVSIKTIIRGTVYSAMHSKPYMESLVPAMAAGISSVDREHCVQILLTIAYHRWSSCRLIPLLLRAFVQSKRQENRSTILTFQYAIKMLGIVDNTFLNLVKDAHIESQIFRDKHQIKADELDSFDTFVRGLP